MSSELHSISQFWLGHNRHIRNFISSSHVFLVSCPSVGPYITTYSRTNSAKLSFCFAIIDEIDLFLFPCFSTSALMPADTFYITLQHFSTNAWYLVKVFEHKFFIDSITAFYFCPPSLLQFRQFGVAFFSSQLHAFSCACLQIWHIH